jgi:hypothetical protein
MTGRLIWFFVALAAILLSIDYWLCGLDRPLPFAGALPMMPITWAILLQRHDPPMALMYSLVGAGSTAAMVALTLVDQTESGHAWMSRIIVAILG